MNIKHAKKFMYRVREDDSMVSLCERFNTSQENILRNNPKIKLYPGEWVQISVNDYLLHIVKPMESLKMIADKYAISQDKLIFDNNLNSHKLFIGQRLKIYCKESNLN